jgi:hypothetical protein
MAEDPKMLTFHLKVEPRPEFEAMVAGAVERIHTQMMKAVEARLEGALLAFLLWLQVNPQKFYSCNAEQLVKEFIGELVRLNRPE